MGLGNSAYQAKDFTSAAYAFQRAVDAHPEAAAAYNNLANVLLAQNKLDKAKQTAQLGLTKVKEDQVLKRQLQQTLDEISASQKNKYAK
jgi:uncharacterized protein HemY